jgi:hypothetical protein
MADKVEIRRVQSADVANAASPGQQASRAFAESAAEAEKAQLDEAGPGHHYVNAAGDKVNPDGTPYKARRGDED